MTPTIYDEVPYPGVLLHDDLAPENRPFHFHELMERAGAHGLQYLAEADFQEMGAHGFPPRLVEILDSIDLSPASLDAQLRELGRRGLLVA